MVDIQGHTQVLGIIGDPVAHSMSPLMHNAALAAGGFDAVYVPWRVTAAHLTTAVRGLEALGVRGVNVTVPHKEAVASCLTQLDETAAQLGSVNTLVRGHHNGFKGYNTDGAGLVKALREDEGLQIQGRRVMLLGAGGAARAAAVALAAAKCGELIIVNRDVARAQALAALVKQQQPAAAVTARKWTELDALLAQQAPDVVVQGTSLGLQGEDVAAMLPWQRLAAETFFYDMLYSSTETPWVAQARQQGLAAADGKTMLARQGELGFALWWGQAPPAGVMQQALADSS